MVCYNKMCKINPYGIYIGSGSISSTQTKQIFAGL